MEDIFGLRLETPTGPIPTASLQNCKYILLLVSAYWCPPCREFTPSLKEFYEEVNESGKQLEIVWLSRDRNEDDYRKYFLEMPWASVPYNKQEVDRILRHYEIEGIPRLYLVDHHGVVVSTKCREDVIQKGPVCLVEWDQALS